MPANQNGSDERKFERYRTIEYNGDTGPVTIIQDDENENAWIQSDTTRDIVA